MKIRPVGAKLFPADGYDEANIAFRHFAKAPKISDIGFLPKTSGFAHVILISTILYGHLCLNTTVIRRTRDLKQRQILRLSGGHGQSSNLTMF